MAKATSPVPVTWTNTERITIRYSGRRKRVRIMTDKVKVVNLLNDLGIGFNLEPDGSIELDRDHAGVDSYPGFFVMFEFNKDDSFKTVGAWE